MANGILDPNDFTIAPNDMRSLQDRMLELRRSLPESLQMPIGGQPQQTQQEQANQSLGDRIAAAATALAQQSTQAQSQKTGEKPSRKGVQQQLDEYQNILDQVNPLKAKQSIGSGTLGQLVTGQDQGGILGTGVQPVDVLAFAIGSAIAPKNSSLYRRLGIAMKVAQLPSQFRKFQEDKIKEFGQGVLHGVNAEIGAANAETAQIKNQQAQQQFDYRNKVADIFDKAGEPAKAAAFRANAVDDFVKLTGDVSKVPTTSYTDYLRSMASGAIPIPDWYMQRTQAKTPEEARKYAMGEYESVLLEKAPIPTPTGAVYRTPSGLADVGIGTRGIRDIQRDLEVARQGGVAPTRTQVGIPAIPAPTAPQALTAPPSIAQPAVPTGLPVDQLLNSPNPRDQWTGRYAGDMLPQTQQSVGALFQKPLDASVRQKLVAQRAAIEYSEDLLNKYNEMVKSYGGEGNFKFTDQMKQWMVTQGSRISGEGLSGAVLSTAADLARRWAQEFGRPFTPEAHDFMAMYNQAQKFARGAMNDAANLATRERDMFAGMLGKPLDKPAFFRATLTSFHDEIAREYNDNLAANKLNKLEGLAPIEPMRGAKAPPKWFRPLTPEQAQPAIRPGEEY